MYVSPLFQDSNVPPQHELAVEQPSPNPRRSSELRRGRFVDKNKGGNSVEIYWLEF